MSRELGNVQLCSSISALYMLLIVLCTCCIAKGCEATNRQV